MSRRVIDCGRVHGRTLSPGYIPDGRVLVLMPGAVERELALSPEEVEAIDMKRRIESLKRRVRRARESRR